MIKLKHSLIGIFADNVLEHSEGDGDSKNNSISNGSDSDNDEETADDDADLEAQIKAASAEYEKLNKKLSALEQSPHIKRSKKS